MPFLVKKEHGKLYHIQELDIVIPKGRTLKPGDVYEDIGADFLVEYVDVYQKGTENESTWIYLKETKVTQQRKIQLWKFKEK